ncbi:hypothetical protein [Pelosinus sp. sgz500959]|uniref:hypothetical protein n=1 Tax=Pelosinus sp. sgz500959 TaxID=3242472 RepID=UPI00366A8138
MADQKDTKTIMDDHQPSLSNRDVTMDHHDYSATHDEEGTTPQKLHDDTIYDNMIFPS